MTVFDAVAKFLIAGAKPAWLSKEIGDDDSPSKAHGFLWLRLGQFAKEIQGSPAFPTP